MNDIEVNDYINDYGEGAYKIIKQARNGLIFDISLLMAGILFGAFIIIMDAEYVILLFLAPIYLLLMSCLNNNMKELNKGLSMKLDDYAIDKAENYIRDFLYKDISRMDLLNYLNATIIEYFTMNPIEVDYECLEKRIKYVIKNGVDIKMFQEWVDLLWFLDIYQLDNDVYSKIEVIENYHLDGRTISLTEIKDMLRRY